MYKYFYKYTKITLLIFACKSKSFTSSMVGETCPLLMHSNKVDEKNPGDGPPLNYADSYSFSNKIVSVFSDR